jgi:hypothetical protein
MPQFTKLRPQIPDEFRDLFGCKQFGSGVEVTALDYKNPERCDARGNREQTPNKVALTAALCSNDGVVVFMVKDCRFWGAVARPSQARTFPPSRSPEALLAESPVRASATPIVSC